MKNNQLTTILSVSLCDLCASVLEKIFNTETTKNTAYHREQNFTFSIRNRYNLYYSYFLLPQSSQSDFTKFTKNLIVSFVYFFVSFVFQYLDSKMNKSG